MDADEIRVNLLSMEDFRDRLAPRLRQTAAVLSALSRSDEPALGGFHHARQTAQRYEVHHAEFVRRVRRLLTALVVSEAATRAVLESYQTDRELSLARLHQVADMLARGDHELFATVLRDAGLEETLFRDPALPLARRPDDLAVGDGQVSG